MSLFLDIGTGAGLAGATGVRPFLPPLLAGALARGDVGIDFDGTDWSFLESPVFLAAVVGLAVASYAVDRSDSWTAEGRRSPVSIALAVMAAVLGALLFAGSLADGGHDSLIGLVAGALCALLAWAAVSGVLDRARRRLDSGAVALLSVYADGVALLLAALAVLIPPVSFLALAGFAVLLLRGRGREGEKYAGLRILR